jgi:hypothetical protein
VASDVLYEFVVHTFRIEFDEEEELVAAVRPLLDALFQDLKLVTKNLQKK